jgi:ketosteroid isomerase-like protein
MRLKQYLISAIATMLVAAGASGSERCTDDDQARAIEAQRQAFNRAIEETDLDTIAAVLAEDVMLITGTDSDLYSGRRAQVDLWRSDFESNERLVYVRTPECVQVSQRFPIALERGRWRGEHEDGRPGVVQGAYSAKWRHDGKDWHLEVEVYMTDECSASICPQDEAAA